MSRGKFLSSFNAKIWHGPKWLEDVEANLGAWLVIDDFISKEAAEDGSQQAFIDLSLKYHISLFAQPVPIRY